MKPRPPRPVEAVFEREDPRSLSVLRAANRQGDARDGRASFSLRVRAGGLPAYEAVAHPAMRGEGMPAHIRPPGAWRPRRRTDDLGVLRTDLARHLWGRWPVPAFLERTWRMLHAPRPREGRETFAFPGYADREERSALAASARFEPFAAWAAGVAAGESLHRARAKEALSRRECHLFLLTPGLLEPGRALWRARALAAGAGTALADSLAAGPFPERAGMSPEAPSAGWSSVQRFLLENPEFLREGTVELLDWAAAMIRERPGWTMRGRTAASARAAEREWHRMVARQKAWAGHNWEGAPISDWTWETGDQRRNTWRRWEFLQITTGKALAAEGSAMRHCVGSYIDRCSRGSCSIHSVRVSRNHHMPERARVLTVEMDAEFSVVQVRGYANRPATEEERGAVRAWARANGLHIAHCAF